MKAIHQIIGKTADEYQNMVLGYYFRWCLEYAYDNKDWQMLLADAALFNWFITEYRKLEDEFLWDYAPYSNERTKPQEAHIIYVKSVCKIQRYHCWPLMVKARSKEILNNESIR